MKKRYFILIFCLVFDFFAAVASFALSFVIIGNQYFEKGKDLFLFSIVVWPLLLILLFYIFKIYSILWRFSRFSEYLRMFAAAAVSICALFVSQMAVFSKCYSLDLYFVTLFLTCLLMMFCRICLKKIILDAPDRNAKRPATLSGNIMIIGAGSAAAAVINEISSNICFSDCKIKCAIDDDPTKTGSYISGVRIVGNRNTIIESAEKYNISVILFAIANCTNEQKYEILNICQQTNCELKIIPSLYQLIDNDSVDISSRIRKVEIEDLLGRDPLTFNIEKLMNYVSGKTVLVTGGGGTIGSELCRQLAEYNPKKLIVFDIYENNAYDIQNELRRTHPKLDVVTLIGSVRDSKRLNFVFVKYHPDIVYHAAAHKHVPLMEDSPNETVKNNVIGTLKTVQCADKYKTEKFVLISTDKAVNPTNIMGASKRICEMIVQSFNGHSDTEFVAVRFGNVLGSNGSVIPLFKKQIEAGGPVTVTDPNIIRYFMTISEAVTLVMLAGASAKGGEIFVLDMGKPVKILTLAENLIKLSGLTPYKDIKIEFVGLRPGEKLYEEMLMSEEGLKKTENSMIYIGKPIDFDESEFYKTLEELSRTMYDENIDIRALVKKIVPTYYYQN